MHKRRISDLVLVLALFAVYAAGAMILATIGSNTYRHTTEVMREDYNLRTGALYVAEKVRQNDVGGSVRLDQIGESNALVLTQRVNRSAEETLAFETLIFVHQDQLRELTYEVGKMPEIDKLVDMSQEIMPMQSIQLVITELGLLDVKLVTPDGVTSSILLEIKSSDQPFVRAAPVSAPAPASDPAAPTGGG